MSASAPGLPPGKHRERERRTGMTTREGKGETMCLFSGGGVFLTHSGEWSPFRGFLDGGDWTVATPRFFV